MAGISHNYAAMDLGAARRWVRSAEMILGLIRRWLGDG